MEKAKLQHSIVRKILYNSENYKNI